MTPVDGVITIIFPAFICGLMGVLNTFSDHPAFDDHPWIVAILRGAFAVTILVTVGVMAVVLPQIKWSF